MRLAELGEISKADVVYSVARNPTGDGDTYVEAHRNGKNIGYLRLSQTGQINHVKVLRKHRRQGVATGLYNEAKRLGYNPQHTEALTRKGRAWKQSL